MGLSERSGFIGTSAPLRSREMARRVDAYRAHLGRLHDWEAYLKAHSGLPGPRANLELVEAVGDEADPELLWRLSASSDEFLALCGSAGLGRLAATDPATLPWLKELAADPRWRVREGVAIALQRLGRASMPKLLDEMDIWAKGGLYVQRAAAAGLCEPAMLHDPADAKRVLAILDRITRSLAAADDRHHEPFRVLRQALGYCWSVAAAALPQRARPLLEKWMRSKDPDVLWVMKSNLSKTRMKALGAEWVTESLAGVSAATPARMPAKKIPRA
jgi:hypothetical protein